MDTPLRPAFLLVHGSWHGPWCFDLLRTALERRGYASETVSLASVGDDPARLGTFADDAATVTAAAAAMGANTVVVGHSYGGAVVAEASFGPNVRQFIMLGAFMPEIGRSYLSYFPPGPLPPFVGLRDDGSCILDRDLAVPFFFADCTPEIAAWAVERLRPQAQQVMGWANTAASWHTRPTTYILLTEDKAIPPAVQRQFAALASASREFTSSHSPFLSRPDDLVDLLVDIAEGPPVAG